MQLLVRVGPFLQCRIVSLVFRVLGCARQMILCLYLSECLHMRLLASLFSVDRRDTRDDDLEKMLREE